MLRYPRAVRIVWDMTPLAVPPTGIGYYLREALRAAGRIAPEHHWVALSVAGGAGTARIDDQLDPLPFGTERRAVVVPGARVWRSLANRAPVPLLERVAGRADAFIGTEWFYPRQRHGVRAAIVYDLVPLRFPHHATKATLRMHRAKLDDVRRADVVFCISRATARDVTDRLGVPAERIRIARPGVGDRFRGARPPLTAEHPAGGRPYVVAVGTLEPRKNLVSLVDAFATLHARHPELALVLVGAEGWGGDPVSQRTAALGLGDAVVRTGYVSTELLPTLVAGARAFCLPSLFEGFGMPVPEAMAAGVPTVASDDESIDEACGDAALRVVARDVDGMAEALETAVFDAAERARLIAAGHAHVAGLTWDACARAITDGLVAAADGGPAAVATGAAGAGGSAYFPDHADRGDRA